MKFLTTTATVLTLSISTAPLAFASALRIQKRQEEQDTSNYSIATDTSNSNNTSPLPSSEAELESYSECNPVIPQRTREDEIMLAAIFGSGTEDGTTYADWLLRYGALLLTQIDEISEAALAGDGDNDEYTSAFATAYTSGILALARAAPMYSCYLKVDSRYPISANETSESEQDQQLMALFERRKAGNSDRVFNYAGLLIDEAREMLLQVDEAISVAITNSGFVSMFPDLNAAFLISFATEAEIYTEGLSQAYESALSAAVAADPSLTKYLNSTVAVSGGTSEVAAQMQTQTQAQTSSDSAALFSLSITIESDNNATSVYAAPSRYYNATIGLTSTGSINGRSTARTASSIAAAVVTDSVSNNGAVTVAASSGIATASTSSLSVKRENGAAKLVDPGLAGSWWTTLLVGFAAAVVSLLV